MTRMGTNDWRWIGTEPGGEDEGGGIGAAGGWEGRSTRTLYGVLGLDEACSSREVRHARFLPVLPISLSAMPYRDRGVPPFYGEDGVPPDFADIPASMSRALAHMAYAREVLGRPDLRARYDASLGYTKGHIISKIMFRPEQAEKSGKMYGPGIFGAAFALLALWLLVSPEHTQQMINDVGMKLHFRLVLMSLVPSVASILIAWFGSSTIAAYGAALIVRARLRGRDDTVVRRLIDWGCGLPPVAILLATVAHWYLSSP